MRGAVMVALCCAWTACAKQATQAFVVIASRGLTVPDDIDALRVTVSDKGATGRDVVYSQTLPLCASDRPGGPCFTLPLSLVLVPGPTQGDHPVLVEVDALLAGRRVIANAGTFTFIAHTKLRLDFVLYQRCLSNLDCASAELACGAEGTCVPIIPEPFTGDPVVDFGVDDRDASVRDMALPADLSVLDTSAPADLATPDMVVLDLAMPDLSPMCTDVGCGGMCAAKCANGKKCLVNTDCAGNACNPGTLVCVASSCSDGFKGGTETDSDCGGGCAPASKCKLNKGCAAHTDCGTGNCTPALICASGPAWLPASNITHPRFSFGAVTGADGLMYAIGTATGTNTRTAENHVVGPMMPWTLIDQLGLARAGLAAATGSDGKIYVIGGANGSPLTYLPTMESYAGTTWATEGPLMAQARADHAAVAAPDNRIYVFGGRASTTGPGLTSTEALTLGVGFTTVDALNIGRAWVGGALASDGHLYAFGGDPMGTDTVSVATVERYQIVGDTWTLLAQTMTTPRRRATAATGADGRTYIVGGRANGTSGTILSSTEVFDPGTGMFTALPSLRTPRASAGALRVIDGRVFVIGGQGPTGILNTVEFYGPDPTLTPAMGAPGTMVQVTAQNFAANAMVDIFFPAASATPIASGPADEDGLLITPITFMVPAGAPGLVTVRLVDRVSNFPVTRTFVVQ